MEEWMVIPGFDRYAVSSHGRVRNELTDRIMAQSENQYGVVTVGLMSQDTHRQHQRSVSLLVANAFLPRDKEAFDTPVCLDGDRYNNHINNLVWRPRWFAVKYNRQFENRWHSPIERPIRDIKTGEVHVNSLECAKWYGLLERDLVLSILNRTFVWPTYQEFEVAR
jgi:NUMOD4 motif